MNELKMYCAGVSGTRKAHGAKQYVQMDFTRKDPQKHTVSSVSYLLSYCKEMLVAQVQQR